MSDKYDLLMRASRELESLIDVRNAALRTISLPFDAHDYQTPTNLARLAHDIKELEDELEKAQKKGIKWAGIAGNSAGKIQNLNIKNEELEAEVQRLKDKYESTPARGLKSVMEKHSFVLSSSIASDTVWAIVDGALMLQGNPLTAEDIEADG